MRKNSYIINFAHVKYAVGFSLLQRCETVTTVDFRTVLSPLKEKLGLSHISDPSTLGAGTEGSGIQSHGQLNRELEAGYSGTCF